MSKLHHILILKKNEQISTLISEAPIKDVYAMLYAAIALVSEKTNQSVETTFEVLADLHRFVKSTHQDL